jgi:hypothetical protein
MATVMAAAMATAMATHPKTAKSLYLLITTINHGEEEHAKDIYICTARACKQSH